MFKVVHKNKFLDLFKNIFLSEFNHFVKVTFMYFNCLVKQI